jgi:hypothetical protein
MTTWLSGGGQQVRRGGAMDRGHQKQLSSTMVQHFHGFFFLRAQDGTASSPRGSLGSGGHKREVRDDRFSTSSFDNDGGVLRWSSGSGEPPYGRRNGR